MIDKILNSKKIAIFGWPATGKSTLGEALSNKLEIPMYSLDLIRWKNSINGKKDDEAFLKEYYKILECDNWIIEGNALDWIDERLNQADVLLFFESDTKTSINNFIKREEKIKNLEEVRKSFDKENEETLDKTIEWIENRYSKKIEKLRLKLKDYKEKLVILNNYNELNKIINELK